MIFYEVSAFTGENVILSFEKILNGIIYDFYLRNILVEKQAGSFCFG
jgi:hypothetical protein